MYEARRQRRRHRAISKSCSEANPEYVAGYFQFGQHLSRIGQLEQARKLLSDGILVAQNAGDMHARDEMQAALALLR